MLSLGYFHTMCGDEVLDGLLISDGCIIYNSINNIFQIIKMAKSIITDINCGFYHNGLT